MAMLSSDLRYALRRLSSTPAFTAVSVLTLALGISATTAIYSVVDALLLRPLPYKDPDRLQQAFHVRASGSALRPLSYDQIVEWRDQKDVFTAIEPFSVRTPTLAGSGEPEIVVAIEVGGGLMTLLGVQPQLGRTIVPDDARRGHEHVIVLSEATWKTRFGADPAVIGKRVRLDNETYDVIGVMPKGFAFPGGRRGLWMPLPLTRERNGRPAMYSSLVQLRDGLSPEQAQRRVDDLAAILTKTKPASSAAGWSIRMRQMGGMNPNERYALYVLFGAVSLVLLIACANLANLLLVEGAAREREIAVRTALGASRGRVMRLLVAETLVLAIAGGAAGLLCAYYGVQLLATNTPTGLTFLNANTITLHWRVLGFSAALTLITALGFGLLPAWRTSRSVPHESLKAGARSATGAPRQERIRRAFVVAQLALSLILLVGAGLLTRTFAHMVRVNPGFDANNLVTASLSLPRWKYSSLEARRQFYDDVIEKLEALPGVKAATVAGGAPPGAGGISFGITFEIEGRGVVLDDEELIMPFGEVQPEYFSVLGIPIRLGRTFTIDEPGGAKRTSVVINESMARQLWKGENPIGQRLRLGPEDPWLTVVGVAGDVYEFEPEKPHGQLALYYPLGRSVTGQMTLIVRTATDPAAMIAPIKAQIWAVDRDQPIISIATLEERYREFFETPRFYAFLMSTFAGIGLVIAAVGLYGVLAYAMAQRTREFGIRIALGAERRDVLYMVLRTGMVLAAAGLLLGAAGSLIVTRALESLLVEIPRIDPITYITVILLLGSVTLAAAWFPARRATSVDPVVALRHE